MPTRTIRLTAEQDVFVEDVVRSGDYQNTSEVIRDALRVLQQRQREAAVAIRWSSMKLTSTNIWHH